MFANVNVSELKPKIREHIVNFTHDLEHIKRNSRGGTSRHELRHIASQMREIADGRLAEALYKAGVTTPLRIPTNIIVQSKLLKPWFVMVGGAYDFDPDVPQFLVNPTDNEIYSAFANTRPQFGLGIQIIEGNQAGDKVVYAPSQSLVMYAEIDSRAARDENGVLDFEARGADNIVPIGKYFESLAVYRDGLVLSRHDIVRFVAIARDGVHYNTKPPKKEWKEKFELMEMLSRNGPHFRDTIIYLFLSIAQDIVNSPDIQAFMELGHRLDNGH